MTRSLHGTFIILTLVTGALHQPSAALSCHVPDFPWEPFSSSFNSSNLSAFYWLFCIPFPLPGTLPFGCQLKHFEFFGRLLSDLRLVVVPAVCSITLCFLCYYHHLCLLVGLQNLFFLLSFWIFMCFLTTDLCVSSSNYFPSFLYLLQLIYTSILGSTFFFF